MFFFLESTYSSLCSLCSSQNCDQPSIDPFQESLDCLVNNDADVAFTALDKAQTFFENPSNAQKYKFLCKDDTVSNPDAPCVWSKQLRTLIVANRFLIFVSAFLVVYKIFFLSAVAGPARSTLEQWLENYKVGGMTPFSISGDALLNHLLSILQIDGSTERIRFIGEVNLKTYVSGKLSQFRKGKVFFLTCKIDSRSIPDEKSELCDTNMKWCTISPEEKQKCLWLSQAALNRGIQPVVKCVESSSQLECINDVKNNKADLLTVDANYGFIAKRYFYNKCCCFCTNVFVFCF